MITLADGSDLPLTGTRGVEMAHDLRREDVTFADRAPLLNEAHVDLPATPAEIWPALADAAAWTRWFRGVRVARYTTPPPHGVGAMRHVEVQRLEVDEEVIAFEPERRFAFSVRTANRAGFEAMVEVVDLEPRGDTTRVTYRQAIETAGWLRPLVPLLRRQLRRELRAGLAGLGPFVASHSPAR
jgi:uncharacterized protein YndB with AHSA1/START domain